MELLICVHARTLYLFDVYQNKILCSLCAVEYLLQVTFHSVLMNVQISFSIRVKGY